uniref:Replication initiator 1 n=1 Tax=Rhinopithecus bieti TaxID=61621 RepID=A0A2K6LK72_RHIBE
WTGARAPAQARRRQRKNRCWNVVAGAPWPWARPSPDSFLGPPRSHPRPWRRSPAG